MSDEGKKIKLIIADDHKMVLEGLASSLEGFDDIELAGTVDNGRDAILMAHKIKPDAIVMDIQMPGLNGIEAARKLRKELPEIKIMAISMHADKRMVKNMLKAGAHGFILKECAVKELAHGIRMMMNGETYICSRMVKLMLDQMIQGEEEEISFLSPRERELLQLITEGGNTKDIATHMAISTKTVVTHRRRLMAKLEITSIAELTKYAIKEGITSLDY